MKAINKAGVVGAGTMGRGIAYVLAQAQIDVLLLDTKTNILNSAKDEIDKLLDQSVSKDILNPIEAQEMRMRLSSSTSLTSLADCDLMIEAISEDLEQKRQIFNQAASIMHPESLLATNTSSLSITQIAEGITNNHRVLGLHFFNPPHVMKLLEIILHKHTSHQVIEQAKILGQRLRKECILVNDSPGFATSRLGISFALEAMRMLESQVAGVLDLDSAMKLGYGHPMGPLMLSDWVGLDIRLAICEQLYKKLDSAVFEPPDILRRMVRAGFLGRKSGTGFYDWENGRALGVSQASAGLYRG